MSHAKQVLKRKNVGACLNAGGAAVKDIVFTHSYVTLPVDKYADLHRNWLVRIFWCRCQRRSNNASAGQSKNTSVTLAGRPPKLGSFVSGIRLGSDYLPAYPSSHGVSGACSD
jgi:hypothetical protein